MRLAALLVSVAGIAASPAFAGLLGTEISLRTLAQSTPSSTPVTTSFERTVLVSDAYVEYPDVGSLFNPGTVVPPGFARSLVNVAIDAGDNYITIDFDNTAPFNRFASAYQNTYIFKFSSAALVTITGAEIDAAVTTLGLSAADVTFSGNELFVNVEGLSFNTSTFARINLQAAPVPEPETYAMFGLGLAALASLRRRARRADAVRRG